MPILDTLMKLTPNCVIVNRAMQLHLCSDRDIFYLNAFCIMLSLEMSMKNTV